MSKITSPLVNGADSKFLRTFDTETIIKLYQDEINLDVSRFFENMNEINLYQCLRTGYRFYHPYTTVGDSLFYEDIASVRSSYYSERWEHKRSLKYIDKKAKVLEVGSGFGSFLSMLSQEGYSDIIGLEFSPLAIKTCRENGFEVDGVLIEELAKKSTKYDVVCSFQVLEHVTAVNSFIQSQIDVLNSGGKMIIGVPNSNPYLYVRDEYHTLNLPPHHAGLWSRSTFESFETIFPVKLVTMEFEPLKESMDYFLKIQKTKGNFFVRYYYKILDRFFKSTFRNFLSKTIDGRNILVVFEKL